jgi:hypothetical protein
MNIRELIDKWEREIEKIKNKQYESTEEWDKKHMSDQCNILTYEYFIDQLKQCLNGGKE